MSDQQQSEQKTYKITKYTSEEKVVTREEYANYLRQELNYRVDKEMDLKVKIKKLEAQLMEASSKTLKAFGDLDTIVGSEQSMKDMEYAGWRYKEMYPKKFAILAGKQEVKRG